MRLRIRCSSSTSRALAIASADAQDWSGSSCSLNRVQDGIDFEAELAGMPDEGKPADIGRLKGTLVAFAAARSSKQADALVIADCRNFNAALAGRIANRDLFHHFSSCTSSR